MLHKIIECKENYLKFKEQSILLYQYLQYREDIEKIKRDIDILFKVVNDDKYIPTYNQDLYKLTSGTIHSSKGLEFKQVIINASDYILSNADTLYLHYVAISRPEERLLIIAKKNNMERYKGYIYNVINVIAKTSELGIKINTDNVIRIID